jgi:hypothetical protein
VATVLGPLQWRVPLEQLQGTLASRLPLARAVPPTLDAALAAARVQLLPQEQRLAAELDYTVTERLTQRGFGGLLGVDFGLRLVPPTTPAQPESTLRLAQVRVSRLSVGSIPPALLAPLRPALDALVAQALDDLVVYRVKPEDQARLARFGYRLDGVRVQADSVLVNLVPG